MKNGTKALVALAVAGVASTALAGGSTVVDISGARSMDLQGSPVNDTFDLSGFLGRTITSIDYDVNYSPVDPSWSQETVFSLDDGGTYFMDASGGAWTYAGSDADSAPHAAIGNHDIGDYVMTTDTLTVELHEWDFDDFPGAADANYGDGSTLTINWIPTPAGLALIGVAGLVGRRRRRH